MPAGDRLRQPAFAHPVFDDTTLPAGEKRRVGSGFGLPVNIVGGSTGSGTPDVYGHPITLQQYAIQNTFLPVGTDNTNVLAASFQNVSDALIELVPLASGATDAQSFWLPPAPQGMAVPSAPTFGAQTTTGGGLAGGVTNYYRVAAKGANGKPGPVSPEGSVAIAAGTATNTVVVRTVPIDGATGYVWYGRTQNGELKIAESVAPFFVDTGLDTTVNTSTWVTAVPSGALPQFDDSADYSKLVLPWTFPTYGGWQARHFKTGSKPLTVAFWGA